MRGKLQFSADSVVIGVLAAKGADLFVAFVVGGSLATLVIGEVADGCRLPSVFDLGAEYDVRFCECGDQVAGSAAERVVGALPQEFPGE